MHKPELDDTDLDRLFDLARGVAPPLPDALAARMLADADAVLAASRPPAAAPAPAPGGWRGFLAAIGGWPALGGLALATVVGVVIGINPPAGLSTLSGGLLGETMELPLAGDTDAIQLLEG